jgi:hypothetical protein
MEDVLARTQVPGRAMHEVLEEAEALIGAVVAFGYA